MTRKATLVKKMDLEAVSMPSQAPDGTEEHSDEEIQAVKQVKPVKAKKQVTSSQVDDEALFGEKLAEAEPVEYTHEPRQRSEKQKQATALMRQKLAEANEKRRLEKEAQKQAKLKEEKKKTEELILQKAMSIRKKQIKKSVLDEISDDDTPIEEIKEIVKKTKQPKKPVAPAIAEKMKHYEEGFIEHPNNKPKPAPVQPPVKQVPKFIFV